MKGKLKSVYEILLCDARSEFRINENYIRFIFDNQGVELDFFEQSSVWVAFGTNFIFTECQIDFI